MLDEALGMAADAPWPAGVRWSRSSRSSQSSRRAELDAVADLDRSTLEVIVVGDRESVLP